MTRKIGNIYEQKAITYLLENGYKVLDTNVHISHKEIDIICTKNDILIIVEVKYRKDCNLEFFPLTNKKKEYLIECSEIIWQNNPYHSYELKFWQIDLIFFYEKGLQYFENITQY